MPTSPIAAEIVERENAARAAGLASDSAHLGEKLARRGLDLEQIVSRVGSLAIAIPTWGVGSGGTRFALFPIAGEPRDVFEKLEDCAVVQQLGRSTPTVSPHFPWDRVDDPSELRERAGALGLGFDAVN